MAIGVGRKPDQVRVLSDLSGLVVGALIDDVETGTEGDAFADALRRYNEDGAPDLSAPWRTPAPAVASGDRAATVLRHLTRDLLKGVSMVDRPDAITEEPASELPENVHPLESGPRDIPALEQASDGTWKPSGSALAAQEEVDASALRRSVPSTRSRYPLIARSERIVLPPAPKRFTEITAPKVVVTEEHEEQVRTAAAEAPEVEGSRLSNEAATRHEPADGRRWGEPRTQGEGPLSAERATSGAEAVPLETTERVTRDSIIKSVAGGIEVVAGPFARFQQLATFVKALRAVPGVQDVTTRQFVRGMVHLRVRHSHTGDLAERLLELTDFSPEVVSSTQDRIELKVDIAE